MTSDPTHPDLYANADPRVYSSNADTPGAGRTFVWAQARWFERVESETENGAVEFSPVADSEEDLRDWLAAQDVEIDEVDPADNQFAAVVRDEFMNQTPLYPEAPELSDQWQ
jgi:hypothetical protein